VSTSLLPRNRCGNAGIERIKTVSDYQERSFGLNYGLLLKELNLFARAKPLLPPH
jgi:peroxiredoxin